MVSFNANSKLIVEIYKYISPVLIWIETMKQTLNVNDSFKQIEFFQLLKQMRDEFSHFDISQNDRNESLFIKIVMIYKTFGLNLIENSVNIKRIWEGLHNDNSKRSSTIKLKNELQNIKIDYQGNFGVYLNLFKSNLFTILNPNANQYQIVLINIIFQFISPIIIWHEKMINANYVKSKLYQLVNEIKNRVCHLSDTNYTNCTHLKEIMKSILVVYNLFGVDLKYSNSKINEINFEFIPLCIEYKENDIREETIEILKNQNDMRNNVVFFRELIDQLVVKIVPYVSFNMKSVLEENEDRNIVVKDKKVSNHITIEINDEKFIDGINTAKDDENVINIKWCIVLGLVIFALYQFQCF